jgi:uncharacterized membrane protein YhhN
MKQTLFFILLFLNICGGIWNVSELSFFTKPLLMPVLIWIEWAETNSKKLKISLTIALLFSLAGDLFLMVSGKDYFIFGLGSFLLAHLTYMTIYRTALKVNWLVLLPFVAFAGLFCFGVLNGHLSSDLEIPVYVYMVIILTMGFLSASRNVSNESYALVLIGALLFIISDSFIAVNQFVNPVWLNSFWVMSTYGVGQYLIVKGLLKGS